MKIQGAVTWAGFLMFRGEPLCIDKKEWVDSSWGNKKGRKEDQE